MLKPVSVVNELCSFTPIIKSLKGIYECRRKNYIFTCSNPIRSRNCICDVSYLLLDTLECGHNRCFV